MQLKILFSQGCPWELECFNLTPCCSDVEVYNWQCQYTVTWLGVVTRSREHTTGHQWCWLWLEVPNLKLSATEGSDALLFKLMLSYLQTVCNYTGKIFVKFYEQQLHKKTSKLIAFRLLVNWGDTGVAI